MRAIRRLRKRKGLTQVMLATQLNKTQQAIAMWESGERKPPSDIIPQIAKELDCEIADLYETEEPDTHTGA